MGGNYYLVWVAGIEPLVDEDAVVTVVGNNQEELALLSDSQTIGDNVQGKSHEHS